MGVRLCTAIDRVGVSITLTKGEFNQAIPWLRDLVKKYGSSYVIDKNGWSHRTRIRFGEVNPGVQVSVERYFKTRFLKYEFKPRGMTHGAFLEMDQATADVGTGSYRSCLKDGTVSYLEVAADFVGRHTSDTLIFRPGIHASQHGSKKSFSSYYLGARTSAMTTVAYNRGEHPGANASEKSWSNLMRVEARLRRPKISPTKLDALGNPFMNTHVCDYQSLIATFCGDPMAVTVLEACRALGSPEAFSIYPQYRKSIMLAAALNRAPWWEPDLLMDGWAETARRQLGMDALGCA